MAEINIQGERYGKLIVVKLHEIKNRKKIWECKCDCGNACYVQTSNLRSGNSKSCGCTNRNRIIQQNTTHKLSKHPLYSVWAGIMRRCYNANEKYYKNYGGRGIIVSDDWHDAKNFIEYSLRLGYEKGLTIDRIDCNKSYEPGNIRYIPLSEQNLNKRTTLMYNGMPFKTYLKEKGLLKHYSTIFARIKYYGWSIEEAINSSCDSAKRKRNNFRVKVQEELK